MAKDAILQFEIDLRRWRASELDFASYTSSEKPTGRLRYMAMTAACDTLRNGGTFVLVVTADTVTMVQRADADEPDPHQGAAT